MQGWADPSAAQTYSLAVSLRSGTPPDDPRDEGRDEGHYVRSPPTGICRLQNFGNLVQMWFMVEYFTENSSIFYRKLKIYRSKYFTIFAKFVQLT